MSRKLITISVILTAFAQGTGFAQSDQPTPLLTNKQMMNGIITPATTTIWGAYQLETETQWQEVANAALSKSLSQTPASAGRRSINQTVATLPRP